MGWERVLAHVAEDVGCHVCAAAVEKFSHEGGAERDVCFVEDLAEGLVGVPGAGVGVCAVEDVGDEGGADGGSFGERVVVGVCLEEVVDVVELRVLHVEHGDGGDGGSFEAGVSGVEVLEDGGDAVVVVGFGGAEGPEVVVDGREVFVEEDFFGLEGFVGGVGAAEIVGGDAVVHLEDEGAGVGVDAGLAAQRDVAFCEIGVVLRYGEFH